MQRSWNGLIENMESFKIGDIIQCINDRSNIDPFRTLDGFLQIHKQYRFIGWRNIKDSTIAIETLDGKTPLCNGYYLRRFIHSKLNLDNPISLSAFCKRVLK
jgi:hypothetical protein